MPQMAHFIRLLRGCTNLKSLYIDENVSSEVVKKIIFQLKW